MTINTIQINTISIPVSELKRTDQRIGTTFEAKNGRKRQALRTIRTTYTLQCNAVAWDIVQILRNAYTSATPITLRDEYGVSITTVALDELCEVTTAMIVADNQELFYDVTLTLTGVIG